MSTGIEAWKNLAEIGPNYPFVGSEMILTIVAVIIWLGWHVMQIMAEKRAHKEAIEAFKKKNGH